MVDAIALSILPVLAIWVRLSAAVLWLPVFSYYRVPRRFLALLLLGIAVPVAFGQPQLAPLVQSEHLLHVFAHEILTGLVMGFGLMLAFMAIDAFGQLLDAQSGLNMAAILGLGAGRPQALTSAFFTAAAISLFFAADLHHDFLYLVARWYALQPMRLLPNPMEDFAAFSRLFHAAFAFGVLMAMPLAALLLLGDVLLAFASRSMPQLNVLFLAFPIKLMIVLVGLLIAAHVMPPVLIRLLTNTGFELLGGM